MTSARSSQQRQRGLNDPKHSKVVRIKESTDVRPARFLDQGVTGIVENDVELAEMPVCLRDRLTHLFWVRDFKREGQNVVPKSFRKDRQHRLIYTPQRRLYRRG
jgi:hypothetical protein